MRLYNKKKSFFDVILKESKLLFFDLLYWFKNGMKRREIFIYPYLPSSKTTLYKISHQLNLSISQKISKHSVIGIRFDDQTQLESNAFHSVKILNSNCNDISKKNVEKIQEQVFGYGMSVNPNSHIGFCVSKSDENAKHDGKIIQCPTHEIEENQVYQIVINNKDKKRENIYFDYRVCVMRQSIPIVYKKYKTEEKRFTNDTFEAEICPLEILPQDIQNKIISFCHKMQCDFCELDVLQDQDSGKWFVIDINKTPYGPPASLPSAEKKKAVAILSNGFQNYFLQ